MTTGMRACPICSEDNVASSYHCTACGASLQIESQPTSTQNIPTVARTYKRPGCVTAYAIVLSIAAVLFAIWRIFIRVDRIAMGQGALGLRLSRVVTACIIVGLSFLLARGLWKLKKWARVITIIVQSLGVLSVLAMTCAMLHDPPPAIGLCGAVVGSAIGGYTVYWFASHSEYFS